MNCFDLLICFACHSESPQMSARCLQCANRAEESAPLPFCEATTCVFLPPTEPRRSPLSRTVILRRTTRPDALCFCRCWDTGGGANERSWPENLRQHSSHDRPLRRASPESTKPLTTSRRGFGFIAPESYDEL